MCAPDKHLIVGLSISTVIAVAAFAAATAHRRRSASATSRWAARRLDDGRWWYANAAEPSHRPRIQPSFRAEPRFQRFNNTKIVGDGVKGRGKSKGTEVSAQIRAPAMATFRPTTRAAARAIPAAVRPGGRRVSVQSSVRASRSAPASPSARSAQPARPCPPPSGRCLRRAVSPARNASTFRPQREPLRQGRGGAGVRRRFPADGIAQVLARHGLIQLESQYFTLTNSTFVRARIANGRPVRVVLQGLGNETTLRFGQPNYLFLAGQGQRSGAARSRRPRLRPRRRSRPVGDPAQYALAKLRIGEAHTLANGDECWSR